MQDWNKALKKLIKHYKDEPPTLASGTDVYRLLVMVILAAQTSDSAVNKVAVDFFKAYPTLKSLSTATAEEITPYLSSIRFHRKKINWLIEIAHTLKNSGDIPVTMKELTALPGVGRKSANIIMRMSGSKADGIMVDLHVLRVADRLGISHATDANQMEAEMMQILSTSIWAEAGSALSALGRHVCRPTNPLHAECILSEVCDYCRSHCAATAPKQNNGLA